MTVLRRIAMWSGPRNISTAMMRSWENRPDTCVIDEPLYAHYLRETGIEHPGTEEIIASQSTDWKKVIDYLSHGSPCENCRIFYQKHMAHHQLPSMDEQWVLGLENCFLIRDPDAVVASYAEKRPNLTPADLGFSQQARLFELISQRQDHKLLVIDSDEFLKNPRLQTEKLCQHLNIEFSESMLTWPSGIRETDGVWGKYWYHNVEKSTGFMPWKKRQYSLTPEQRIISDACRPYYERLREFAICNS